MALNTFTKADFKVGTVFVIRDNEYVVLPDSVVNQPHKFDLDQEVPAALNDGRNLFQYLYGLDDLIGDGVVILPQAQQAQDIPDQSPPPVLDMVALLTEALREIILLDIHSEGDDIDNYDPAVGHYSRSWVGPYGLIAQRALKKVKNAKG